jgi:hypothetical protein
VRNLKMPTIDEEAQRHAECTSAVVISGLLSAVQVDMCLEAGEVWPHMCEMSESCGGPCAGMLCAELEGRAHDLAYPDEAHPDQTSPEGYDGPLHAARQRDGAKHIMMYLHREGFIQQSFPELWATIRSGIDLARPLEWLGAGYQCPLNVCASSTPCIHCAL